MCSDESTRFPKSAIKRYTEIILRHIYQCGGRERYVPVADLEDALGLEQELILELCRKQLVGEVYVADRPLAELEQSAAFESAFERHLIRDCFCQPHVRIRPGCARLTEQELLRAGKKRTKRRRKSRR